MSKAKPKAKGTSRASKPRKSTTKSKSPAKASAQSKPLKLLSGGNPQIAKADGDAPVQAYIAGMPAGSATSGSASTRSSCSRCNVRKAVKWNSPFFGIEGQGWFMSSHVFTRYVNVTFFDREK